KTTTFRHSILDTGHENHSLLLVQRHTRMVPRQDTEEVRYHRGRVGEEEWRETRSTTLQGIDAKRKARRRLRMKQRPQRGHKRHLNCPMSTKDLVSILDTDRTD